jgi:hypothetical protein
LRINEPKTAEPIAGGDITAALFAVTHLREMITRDDYYSDAKAEVLLTA